MKFYNIPICEAYNSIILEEVSNKILLQAKKYWNTVSEEEFKPILNNFLTNIRVKLQPPQNDINFWFKKPFSEFKDFVENYKSNTEKKTEQKYKAQTTKDGGGKKIAENGEYELWKVDSYEASKELGRFYRGSSTEWCISTDNQKYWYEYYYSKNYRIYFLIRKEKQNNNYDKIAIVVDENNNLEFWDKLDKQFSNINNILEFKYFNPYIKYYNISKEEFERVTYDMVKAGYILSEEQFIKCSDELKLKCINKKIEDLQVLQLFEFNWAEEKLNLNEYTNKRIEIGSFLPEYEFERCPTELKIKHINKKIERGGHLHPFEFKWCSDELKLKYINKHIEEGFLPPSVFKVCPDELKLKYINKRLKNQDFMYDIEFKWCPDELKLKYIQIALNKKYGISKMQFDWCSDELKFKYVTTRLNCKVRISKKEKDWYLNYKAQNII